MILPVCMLISEVSDLFSDSFSVYACLYMICQSFSVIHSVFMLILDVSDLSSDSFSAYARSSGQTHVRYSCDAC